MANSPGPGLLPCPHCGQQHADDVLLCPNTERLVPLEGRILDGKFRFVRQLGEGGMGAVWKAENILVKKLVAIKMMHVQFSRDEGVLARFRNEATAAGRIGNRHICDILDLGRSPLGPYIVMEMLNGSDFADFIVKRQGRVEPGVIVMVVRQALIGLAAAHGVGIVHRDLKPENIFLHEPEPNRLQVKLMDFGISKFTQGENAGKTGMGVLMGTPEYMSPEQTEGAAQTDARTDIWAMGVILYWALAGRNPFVGATMAATLINVAAKDPPPLQTVAGHVQPGLADVIARCLRKNPQERWPSAQALSDALEPYENAAGAPWLPASGTAISAPQPSMHTKSPPPPGATVASTGMPQVAITPPPGATAFASGPPQAMHPHAPTTPPQPPQGPAAFQHAASPTLGTVGTPAATGPTWSGEMSGPGQSAPTIGGFGNFDAVADDRRPDRNIGGGKGLLIGVLVLLVGGGGAAAWYATRTPSTKTDDKHASNDKSEGGEVAVGADGGAKADGGEAKTTAGDAKDTAGEAKDTAGEAKDTAGEAKAEGGDAKDTSDTADTKAEGGDAKDSSADTKAEGGDAKDTSDTADTKADGGNDTKADGGEAGGEGGGEGGTPATGGEGGNTGGGNTGGNTGGDPDPTGGDPDPTGGGGHDPKPPPSGPKIDKGKVKEKGSFYFTKSSVGGATNISQALAKCGGKIANVKGWKLPSMSQAKSLGLPKTWVADGTKFWSGSVGGLPPKAGPGPVICVKHK